MRAGVRCRSVLVLVLALALAVPGVASAQAPGVCVPDRTGDPRTPANPDRPDMVLDPVGEGDLSELCLAGDGGVRVTTVAPMALGTDDVRWQDGASAVTVGVADADGTPAGFVVAGLDSAGVLGGTVLDAQGTIVGSCEVAVEKAVVALPADCLAQIRPSGEVALQASLRMHTDPLTEYAPVQEDVTPDGGGFVVLTGDAVGEIVGAPAGPARLAGPTRIHTAAAISRAQFPDGAPAAYLARADDLADTVTGGALTDGPILLVPSCAGVPDLVVEELARLGPAEVVALGGEAAVCEDTLRTAAADATPGRLAGADRFDTAAEVAARAFPGGAEDVFLARDDDLADAVAASAVTTGPVLLVPSCGEVPNGVRLAVRRMLPKRVIAIGGEAAICEETLQALATGDEPAADLDALRLAGEDRFQTATAIAQRVAPGGAPLLYLARADDPADAVAGGVLTRGVTALVPRCDALPDTLDTLVASARPDRVVALGGVAAVCDAVLDAVAAAVAKDR